MPKSTMRVNSRGARRLTADELETRILEARRTAVTHHLSEHEWAAIDRLRNRRARLLKETGL
jgi:hypothetical protein